MIGHACEYSATTSSIKVVVSVSYLGEQNIMNENCYIWAYSINMSNEGDCNVQLLNRYWQIIDNKGIIEEVTGTGVVGEQPILTPKETFEYTSGAYLNTVSGVMKGHYEFLNEDLKEMFKVEIPTFSLDSPYCQIYPN